MFLVDKVKKVWVGSVVYSCAVGVVGCSCGWGVDVGVGVEDAGWE